MENKKKNDIPHLKWYGIPTIIPWIRPHFKKILMIIIMFSIDGVIAAALPLFQNYAINHFVGEKTLDTLVFFTVAYITTLFFQCLVDSFGAYNAFQAEVLVDRDVRQLCFDHVQTLSFSYFNQNSVGYIHSRIISDPNRIGEIVSWGLMDAVVDLGYIVSIFVIMFALEPRLAVLLLIIVPVMVVITIYFQKHLHEENAKVRELNSQITGDFNEGITGAPTVKSLVVEDILQKDFEKDTLAMRLTSIRAAKFRFFFHGSVVFVSSIALAIVLWRGGILNREGLMLLGSLSVFMNYATSMAIYVQDGVNTIANLISCQVNIERINRLLNTKSDVSDRPEVIEKYGDMFTPKKENWEELYGDIEFSDVTFHYPDGDENVLEHFNLKVPKGNMVAIVGETGAGKSTMVNLVCRFFEPTEGKILIDGKDARDRSQLWLHSHIGYVLQTPHLFSGTILENLRYGNPDATMEEIELACKRVHADKVIEHMENGYDSQVGEGGGKLSTGEKQLISFARALLANPQILILDEATSSVDTLTEKAIQNAIGEVTKGRTSFVIAHRLSTIREADTILAIRDGKIVERGSHDELMKAKGYYYGLYTRQFVKDRETEALM